MRWVPVLTVLAFLGACAEQASTSSSTASSQTQQQDKTVPVGKAMAAFREICVDTAPKFNIPAGLMAAHGLVRTVDTGAVYHSTGTISAKIHSFRSRSGTQIKRCSITYVDEDKPAAATALNALMPAFGAGATGPQAGKVRNNDGGTRPSALWNVRVNGQNGTFMHIPHAGGRNIGALILDFPVPVI